jgi:hypothetical protein
MAVVYWFGMLYKHASGYKSADFALIKARGLA